MVLIGSEIWCRFGEIFLGVGYTSFAICFVLVLFVVVERSNARPHSAILFKREKYT